MPAEVKILVEGFTNADSVAETGEEKTCPTITLVRDGDLVMVVDPGVLENRQILIDALKKEGLDVDDINMVCITHSHLDHYRNIGMFPDARAIDFFGIWDKNTCEEWQEQFTSNIQIIRTPGHDYTSITLIVNTSTGLVAICGDVFWRENSPEYDHNARSDEDQKKLKESRGVVLRMADWIVPGHAGMYKVEKGEKWNPLNLKAIAKGKQIDILPDCKKCKRPILRKQDRCMCQPWLCYHCCECDLDCDLCSCKHKK